MAAAKPSRTAVSPGQHALAHAFARIHRGALGAAVGVVLGLSMFLVTAFHVIARPPVGPNLALLSQYFYGYDLTWMGALVGACWGALTGFAIGWFAAFVRNLVVSISLFMFRTRAELARTTDFLDHI